MPIQWNGRVVERVTAFDIKVVETFPVFNEGRRVGDHEIIGD